MQRHEKYGDLTAGRTDRVCRVSSTVYTKAVESRRSAAKVNYDGLFMKRKAARRVALE